MSASRAARLALACAAAGAAIVSVPGAVASAGAAPAGTGAATSASGEPVEISLSRERVSTRLGESFGFGSRIVNASGRQLPALVAHLNVVGLTPGVYVDPEDWSSERTQQIPSLRRGESVVLPWTVKAVNDGKLAVYVVVLPREDPASAPGGLAVSPAVDVRIAERRTLNSGGVLPLALGVPALLGLAALGTRRRRTR